MSIRSKKSRRPLLAIVAGGLVIALGYVVASNWQVIETVALGASATSPVGDEVADTPTEAEHGHDHGDGAPSVKTTLWAEKIDIFLERPYPVAGTAIEPLFHVTVMNSGSPVTDGSLVFEASGPAEIKVRSAEPTRPGIFIPAVTFPRPGTYQARMIVESPEVEGGGETIELPPIVVYASAEEALAGAQEAGEEDPVDAIGFLKEQQWRVGLVTSAAEERELVERLAVPGRVIVPQGAGAIVGSPVAGKAVPPDETGFPTVGDKVVKGQVLAVVEPAVAGADAVQLVANQAQLQTLDADLAVKQLEIESRTRNTELRLKRAQDILDRKQQLAKDGILPGKEVLAADHEVRLAQAELDGLNQILEPYKAARKRLATVIAGTQATGDVGSQHGDMRVTLRSPISGTIVEASVTSGELIDSSHELFHVVNLDTLWIEANVSEYDLGRVQEAPGASYRLAAYPERVVPIQSGGGRLVNVGALVDADTRTVPIRYEVPNPDGTLRVGMFVELLVETNSRQRALAVPNDAVADEGGELVVYVQRGGETFERRRVEVGIRDTDHIEIRDSLSPGDRVATKGAYFIRLATLSKQTIGHGHTH